MQDLKSSTAMWWKGVLFVGIAGIASALLVAEAPRVRVAILLAVAIWASCRAYYFAFYVIQHYVDPGFRFSGLGAFLAYAWKRRRRR